ncbi:MAG: hypothetical protein ACREAC_04575 [Blastocatellia bacterium]
MDYKKLAKWIMGLGGAVLVVGLIVYATNQPLHSGPGVVESLMATIDSPENSARENTRTLALGIMGVGAVIAGSGLAVFLSAKKE